MLPRFGTHMQLQSPRYTHYGYVKLLGRMA